MENETKSNGFQLGAVIDIGIFSYIGIFIEANYGYAKSSFLGGTTYNFDGIAIYFGASYRTSYGLIF
ncbi:MAG: hypothetical protein N2316_01505 [Spirochaetes bacterium]|nr:hypothetical protein [Spirochaetota bacterium]